MFRELLSHSVISGKNLAKDVLLSPLPMAGGGWGRGHIEEHTKFPQNTTTPTPALPIEGEGVPG
jgi:hypothetical protein